MMAIGGDLKVAGISTAWAIVRGFPGKEKMMVERLIAQGFDVCQPKVIREGGKLLRGKRLMPQMHKVPLLPGYVFVRPPMGSRWRLCDQVYVAHHLDVVLFDTVIRALKEYADEETAVMQEKLLARIKRGAVQKSVRSLKDIAALLGGYAGGADAESVDTNHAMYLFNELKAFEQRTRASFAATFDQYLHSDEAVIDRPGVRRPW